MGLIGMFLNSAAQSSYGQVLLRESLQGEPVRRFMNPSPIVVNPSLDLQHWVDDFVYRYHHRAFPVASNGHLEGLITTESLNRLPRTEWHSHTVGEMASSDLNAISISADADALDAFGKMQRTNTSRLLVSDNGRLVGIVTLKDLLRFLNLKMELENESGKRG